jgi:hypothetical protein
MSFFTLKFQNKPYRKGLLSQSIILIYTKLLWRSDVMYVILKRKLKKKVFCVHGNVLLTVFQILDIHYNS